MNAGISCNEGMKYSKISEKTEGKKTYIIYVFLERGNTIPNWGYALLDTYLPLNNILIHKIKNKNPTKKS